MCFHRTHCRQLVNNYALGAFCLLYTSESTQCYAAALDFLAQRYSDPDMRIAHWIIHNEVDGGIHWTNMGDEPIATFMDTYLRSMRMCCLLYTSFLMEFVEEWRISQRIL